MALELRPRFKTFSAVGPVERCLIPYQCWLGILTICVLVDIVSNCTECSDEVWTRMVLPTYLAHGELLVGTGRKRSPVHRQVLSSTDTA